MRYLPGDGWPLETIRQREWIETDGLGNYAAGTISGIHTRRYHGLLIAEREPGAGRRLLCAKIEVAVTAAGTRRELSANQYVDTISPQGYLELVEFRLEPWPIWTWRVGELVFEQQVAMLRGRAATVVGYRVVAAPGPVALELRPLIAGRDHHAVAGENWSFRRQALWCGRRLSLEPYDPPSRVCLHFSDGRFESDGYWYHGFRYDRERERGIEYEEDLFNPGAVTAQLDPGGELYVTVAGDAIDELDPVSELATERERRAGLGTWLQQAGDAFRTERGGPTVTAGYPWFGPRLRDTLIAAPGLTVGCGSDPAPLLQAVCRQVELGAGEAAEGDAALWLAWAVDRLEAMGKEIDPAAVKAATEALVQRLQQGAQRRLHLQHDGLLAAAAAEPATWMNAVVGGRPVTPRDGKPIETNALWYATLSRLAELTGDDRVARRAERVRAVILDRFWSDQRGYLADRVDGPAGDDGALRPNQLIAAALPGLLPDELAARVLRAVEPVLLTPYGPRTLAPGHPDYRGRHAGNLRERDLAYHNGSIFPWLLGPWADCLRRLTPDAPLAGLLTPFEEHLTDHGLGQISELFCGDPPHRPSGTIAHAVSVAELLRVAWHTRQVAPTEPPISAAREPVT